MATVKPILRIFDYDKALAHYADWLGFKVDWEYRPEGSPAYLQISLKEIVLHLSEHSGDCTPDARVFIDDFANLRAFHQSLLEKNYKYNRPGLYVPFYDEQALEMTAIDPFANRLTFVERNAK